MAYPQVVPPPRRRLCEPAQPWLLAIRAILVLAALGTIWLTLRGHTG